MGDESFSEKILTDKLSKLNSSQQSIESLSKWCVYHRKRAKQVVETWERLFKSTTRERRVSLLYLSNDILQNSRRKGSEFVNEFWKVLPAALKDVYDSGDENSRKVASRLIDIWEERKVFGSRGQNLKSEVLGDNPAPVDNVAPVNNVRTPTLIKVVKRDANSMRIKLAVGGLPEKILTAMHMVHDETVNEETALDNCHNAISSIQALEMDAANDSSQGNLNSSDVIDNLQKHEDVIRHTISQLQKSEEIRLSLITQLREALQDQESKLEVIQNELLVARSQIEQAANIKLRLTSTSSMPPNTNHSTSEPNFTPTHHVLTSQSTNLSTSLTTKQEDSKKAAAASMAAKLAASASSAQMLSSILSSLVAEEAASQSSGIKRPKLDPAAFSNAGNPEGSSDSAYFGSSSQMTTNIPAMFQSSASSSQLQAPFIQSPPPQPVPPVANQSVQSNIMGLPYNYGANNLYAQPLPSNSTVAFARPGGQPQQVPPQQPQPQQQPPGGGGYFGALGGFYGQSHQPLTPPIHSSKFTDSRQ